MSPPRQHMTGEEKVICILLAFLFPPAAVGLADRAFTGAVCLNILLSILGWIPGIIHAIIWVFYRGARGSKPRDRIPFTSNQGYYSQSQPQPVHPQHQEPVVEPYGGPGSVAMEQPMAPPYHKH